MIKSNQNSRPSSMNIITTFLINGAQFKFEFVVLLIAGKKDIEHISSSADFDNKTKIGKVTV